jgi:4-aminobutyrate aminotransferase
MDYLVNDAEHLSPALNRAFDIVVTKGSGSYLFDTKDNRYLDLTAGIAVNQLGHSHPEIVKVISEQAALCIHTSCVVHYPANIELATKLAQIMPGNISNSFFSNSGAEAIDGAIKLAKLLKPERPNIIVHRGGFHGRTVGSVSLTNSKAAYRKYFGLLMPGVYTIPFPNIYEGASEAELQEEVQASLDELFDKSIAPETVAAIFVEPIQGEGGYIPAPGLTGSWNYLKFLRELSDKHGIVLVFDEVQSGMGRTGKWFASEHYGVTPDILVMAKGLSGGLPLGAFAASKEMMYRMPPGSHGSTFGGNPVSCRAALKLIEIIERDSVMQRVTERSKQIFDFFESKFPGSTTRTNQTLSVRGVGLMIALCFKDADIVNKIKKFAFEKQVLLLGCGTYGNIIRLAPDLIIDEKDLETGLEVIAAGIKSL